MGAFLFFQKKTTSIKMKTHPFDHNSILKPMNLQPFALLHSQKVVTT